MTNKINSYIKSNPRNKIIISNSLISGIVYCDIGSMLSRKLLGITNQKHFSLKSKSLLDDIVNDFTFSCDNYGDTIAITNIAILFETSLGIDFVNFIDKYSQNSALFIDWKGQIENNVLYLLTKRNGIKINIDHLSHIIV